MRTEFETALTIPGSDDYVYGGIITLLIEKPEGSNDWAVISGHTSTPGGPPGGGESSDY